MWEAYLLLDSCRTMGFSAPDPIRFSEMKALAEDLGLEKESDRQRFYRRIKILDRTYLEFIKEKQDGSKEKQNSVKEKKNG